MRESTTNQLYKKYLHLLRYLLLLKTLCSEERSDILSCPVICSDFDTPFSRWDSDRVAAWLHHMGLSMYVGECKRWVRNGDQLLRASSNDLEKVKEHTYTFYKAARYSKYMRRFHNR